MKKLYFLGSFLLLGFKSLAQCPVGDQYFYTQGDIDNFLVTNPTCTSLPGRLMIDGSGSTITNLNGFINLTSVAGQLNIFETGITSLGGLTNLTTVGGLVIDSNPGLTDLAGLEDLTSAGTVIGIFLNENLSNISALAGLSSLPGDFGISDNPALTVCAITSVCENFSNLPGSAFVGNGTGCSNNSEVEEACQTILPVVLQDFKIKKEHSSASLTWTTTSESNSSHFLIEHSKTGKMWRTLNSVAAKGAGTYSFTDKTPSDGANYYRLRMIDLDESFAYSKMLAIHFDIDTAPYPNPVLDKVMIKNVDWSLVQQVELFNSKGALVIQSQKIPSTGLDVSHVSSGLYTVRLTDHTGSVKKVKIIKE